MLAKRDVVRRLVSRPAGDGDGSCGSTAPPRGRWMGGGAAMSVIEPGEITLRGRSLSYVQAGSGPVLLLIHGVAGTVESFKRGSEQHRPQTPRS